MPKQSLIALIRRAERVCTDNLNGLTGIVDNFILAEANLITPYRVKSITRGDLDARIELKQFASKTVFKWSKKRVVATKAKSQLVQKLKISWIKRSKIKITPHKGYFY